MSKLQVLRGSKVEAPADPPSPTEDSTPGKHGHTAQRFTTAEATLNTTGRVPEGTAPRTDHSPPQNCSFPKENLLLYARN